MKKVTAHFNAEIYEVFDQNNILINRAVTYEELLELCEDEGYELLDVTGTEDDEDYFEEEEKQKTNIDFITHFMNFGSPLNQMFVIDAVSKQAKMIVENEKEVLESMKGSFIDGNAWVRSAKDFLKQSEEFYK